MENMTSAGIEEETSGTSQPSQPPSELNALEAEAVEEGGIVESCAIESKSISNVDRVVSSTEENSPPPHIEEPIAEAVIPEEKSSVAQDPNNNKPFTVEDVSSEISALSLKETAVEQSENVSLNEVDQLHVKDIEEIVPAPAKEAVENINKNCDIPTANSTQHLSSSQASQSVVECVLSEETSSSNVTVIGKNEETIGDVTPSLSDEPVRECITPSETPSSPNVNVSEETSTANVTSSLPQDSTTSVEGVSMVSLPSPPPAVSHAESGGVLASNPAPIHVLGDDVQSVVESLLSEILPTSPKLTVVAENEKRDVPKTTSAPHENKLPGVEAPSSTVTSAVIVDHIGSCDPNHTAFPASPPQGNQLKVKEEILQSEIPCNTESKSMVVASAPPSPLNTLEENAEEKISETSSCASKLLEDEHINIRSPETEELSLKPCSDQNSDAEKSSSIKSEEPSLESSSYQNIDSEFKIGSDILEDWASDSASQNPSPRSANRFSKEKINEETGNVCDVQISKCSSSPHADGKIKDVHLLQVKDDLNNNIADDDSKANDAVHKIQLNELFEGPIGYEEDPEDSDATPYTRTVVYGCSVCFTIVGCTKASFIRHQKEYHWISLQCKVCKRKFSTTKGYENHMTTHIRYPCLHCPKEFRHQLEVEDHQAQHFPNKLFRCDRCGEEFYLKSTLRQHCSFMGEKCPEIQRNVHRIQEQLATSQTEELVKCRRGCSNVIPKIMMKAHMKYHSLKEQQDYVESRKRAKRMRLESDV